MRPSRTVKNPQPRNPRGSRHSRIATSPASWMTSGIQVISAEANSRENISRMAARPSTGLSATWWLYVRPHGGNERTLCGAGRNDNLDESGFCVVDQARYDAAAGQGSPGDFDVDAYGGLRV